MPPKRKPYNKKKNSIWNSSSEPNSINLSSSPSSVDLTNHSNEMNVLNDNDNDSDMFNNHAAARTNHLFSDVDMEISNDIDQCIREYSKKKLPKPRNARLNNRNKLPVNISYDQKSSEISLDQNDQPLSYTSERKMFNTTICEHLQNCDECKNTIYQCIEGTNNPPVYNLNKNHKSKRQRTQVNQLPLIQSDESRSDSDESSINNVPVIKRKKVVRKTSRNKKCKTKNKHPKSNCDNDDDNDGKNDKNDSNYNDSIANDTLCVIL